MSACQHNQCQHEALQAAEQLCAKLGARFTEHRRRVFEIIWQDHKALTAADIMAALDNRQPPITYRALEFLKDAGLIHHITSLNAYIGCLHPEESNHVGQMLICEQCKDVTELVSEKTLQQLSQATKEVGFSAVQTHIEVLGTCKQCANTSAA